MADIRSIDMRNGEIILTLRITDKEYATLRQETRDLLLLPTNDSILNERLTTGKLGNSNRIMLPKKILEKHDVKELPKKVASRIFRINDDVFLLIKLKKSKTGIPVFK